MQEKSTKLGDAGAACMAIIQSYGVTGVGAMSDQQRTEVMQKVEAL
jgi:hypothetical protein